MARVDEHIGGHDMTSGKREEESERAPRRRSDFYPVRSLADKRNYKRFFRIERDGSIRESVHLDVPDMTHRERLICIHYLRHRGRHFLSVDVGVTELERGGHCELKPTRREGAEFFLEVTSVADSQRHFEINKREERFTKWAREERIPVHELRKLADLFPSEVLQRVVEQHARESRGREELVSNPLREEGVRVFLSSMLEPEESLSEQLRAAIRAKAQKAHDGKASTVLVVDNRTSAFGFEDYRAAAGELEALLEGVPFPEVWLYTGYYSDDDGNNAEFSFAPLKVTSAQAKVLRSLELDSRGVHMW